MRALILAAAMLASGNRFALELYAQLRGAAGNVVVSPFNVAQALSNVEKSAKRETAAELRRALHGAAADSVPGVVSDVHLWRLDFTKADAAAARINAWVATVTRGNIRGIVEPRMLTGETSDVLTAVVWMKAAWEHPFDAGETRSRPFHLAAGDVDVPTMQRRSYTQYAKLDGLQLIELPHVEKSLTMWIVLPDRRDGLATVESTLSTAALERWKTALHNEDVDLRLPRFTSAASTPLIAPLRRMGVKRLFARRSKEPFVSHFVEAARVVVDEQGTEASSAAISVTDITATLPPPPPKPFIADHPFLYIIRSGDQILFIGRVMDPRS